MIKAYIILAHKNPQQLLRLIQSLNDGFSSFFIHIDKSIDLNEFKSLEELDAHIELVDRVASKWASFGLVKCTLNSLTAIKQSVKKFDRIILLSGQDYPIKSNAFINNALKESAHSIFFEYWPLPNYEKWPKNSGGMYRVDKYFFGLKKHQLFLSKSLNFLSKQFPFLKRKMVLDMKPFAGSQWWIIDMYALNYILDFVERHPEYIKFHKYTFCSDELFFQMILLNSKDKQIINNIENDNKRFMKWQNPSASHPEILRKNDFEIIKNSKKLFARKFDDKCDTTILTLIDDSRLKEPLTHN